MHLVTIPKDRLLLIAGLVWCAAGAMVSTVGLPLELGLAPSHLILLPLSVVIFVAFYVFVFSRLVRKHTRRILARPENRLPFWQFFNTSSWVLMAVMMMIAVPVPTMNAAIVNSQATTATVASELAGVR